MAFKLVENYKIYLSPKLKRIFWVFTFLQIGSHAITVAANEDMQLFGTQIFAIYYIALEVKQISYIFLVLFLAYLLKPKVANKFIGT